MRAQFPRDRKAVGWGTPASVPERRDGGPCGTKEMPSPDGRPGPAPTQLPWQVTAAPPVSGENKVHNVHVPLRTRALLRGRPGWPGGGAAGKGFQASGCVVFQPSGFRGTNVEPPRASVLLWWRDLCMWGPCVCVSPIGILGHCHDPPDLASESTEGKSSHPACRGPALQLGRHGPHRFHAVLLGPRGTCAHSAGGEAERQGARSRAG